MTDGLPDYKHLREKPTHLNHSAREYARTDNGSGHSVHVNTVESFNGMMRRVVIGVFHSISVKHLGRYASEASHRWNHRTRDVWPGSRVWYGTAMGGFFPTPFSPPGQPDVAPEER